MDRNNQILELDRELSKLLGEWGNLRDGMVRLENDLNQELQDISNFVIVKADHNYN